MKKGADRVKRVEDKVDGADILAAQMASRIDELKKVREAMRDDVSYLQSQSMKNNLMFTSDPEDNASGNETPEVTELKLRQYFEDDFLMAREFMDSIRFERVHRSPGAPTAGKVRNIVTKFSYFEEREMARKHCKECNTFKDV
ncbi:hypothetical protein DPMN_083892 [Dreissena polymorpha]|uniref:Uncharacterized protein n=1 Tax=Dreissena polymorpha TaxID=45954 RepID=A0A9D4BIR3_DREPO|nr:hypothetical protein DPMN_083892 [Dreissena polymorpha]